jgi:D-alanine transaminase
MEADYKVAMNDCIWLNGEIIPMSEARLGVEDRGFQFADGVYEVLRLYNAKPFTQTEHLTRLEQSAKGIQLNLPITKSALAIELSKLTAASGVRDGMIYLQLTRGQAARNHIFPTDIQQTLLFYARPLPPIPGPGVGPGTRLRAVKDERWHRCWIKAIALLPNVLAKNQAIAAGADEAVFVDNGIVSECAASNLFAVIDGRLITHPVGSRVLPGITRAILLECAKSLDITVEERPLTEKETIAADELFITSTTREISWVGTLNEQTIGSGNCGRVTRALHESLRERVSIETDAYHTASPVR